MTSSARGGVRADLRGLAWPYAALERKLEIGLDRAHIAVADLQRKCAEGEQRLQELQRMREVQLRALQAVPLRAEGWDVHRISVNFLVEALVRVGALEDDLAQLRVRADEAREACASAHQRLDTVRKLRAAAEAAYLQVQSRRQAKEADLAWLCRRGSTTQGRA